MTTLVRTTENSLNHLFHWLGLDNPGGFTDFGRFVPVETYTKDGRYVVRADLPGVDPDKDIDVTVEGDLLTIYGERREEERDNGHSEVRYGSYLRQVRLPEGAVADDITASYDAGVLEVAIPVAQESTEPIKILVQRPAAPAA